MYRSDKLFMKNPATAACRIYIGNLAETVVPDNLDERFSNHGKILGLVLQRGFGFVQYEKEAEALSAINNENGVMFFGRKLNVKQAMDNTKAKGAAAVQGGNNPQFNQSQNNSFQPNQNNQNPSFNNQNKQNPSFNNQNNQNFPNNNFQNNRDNNFQNNRDNNFQNNRDNNFQNNRDNNFQNNRDNNFQNRDNNFQNKPNFNQNKPNNNNFNQNKPLFPTTPIKLEPNVEQVEASPTPKPLLSTPIEKPINQQNPTLPQPPQQNEPPPIIQNKPPLMSIKPLMSDIKTQPDSNKGDKRNHPRNEPYHNNRRNHSRFNNRDFEQDNFRESEPFFEPTYPEPNFERQPIIDRPERNDCEIIVVSKALTEYAEFIEQRLKSLGLIVDLLFPNEDVPIGRVLANISSRGCLYAILIMPLNEDHRSITLNILHGIPEEHRNMPIEDALILIMRNFHSYMRGPAGVDADKMTLISRHPEPIQIILNLIAENRQIVTTQYDKLVNYLQEKRELQKQFEIKEGLDLGKEPECKTKQAELQNRIMNILNKKPEELAAVETPPPETTPILNDPTVQKALDSLLLGDMFKSIAS